MTGAFLLLLASVVWLAYSNGANDNYKGVATLFGTGTTDYRSALRWATLTTFSGSVASLFLASTLVKAFSGKGLVANEIVSDPLFLMAVGLGAAATVFLATRLGIPISTTHSLTGALVGAGLFGAFSMNGFAGIQAAVNFAVLGKTFLVPLLVSPLVSIVVTYLLYFLFTKSRTALGIERETCLCIGQEVDLGPCSLAEATAIPMDLSGGAPPALSVEPRSVCEERYLGRIVGIDAQKILDTCHFLSAGAVSFARGLNDTPKIVSLLVAAQILNIPYGLALVGGGIALGGWISARKVAETMSHDITRMNHGQGFTANLVTALLVIFASRWGVPVSTTHVSCGSLFGIGMANGEIRWRVFAGIFMAWVATLPLAALCAALAYWLASFL